MLVLKKFDRHETYAPGCPCTQTWSGALSARAPGQRGRSGHFPLCSSLLSPSERQSEAQASTALALTSMSSSNSVLGRINVQTLYFELCFLLFSAKNNRTGTMSNCQNDKLLENQTWSPSQALHSYRDWTIFHNSGNQTAEVYIC